MADIVCHNNAVIGTIRAIIPPDFDLSSHRKLPMALLEEEKSHHRIISWGRNNITIWDGKTGVHIKTLYQSLVDGYTCISPNRQKIFFGDGGTNKIWSTITYELIHTFVAHEPQISNWTVQYPSIINISCSMEDPSTRFISSDHSVVKIWDATNYKLVGVLPKVEYIRNIYYRSDIIFVLYNNSTIIAWNANTFTKIAVGTKIKMNYVFLLRTKKSFRMVMGSKLWIWMLVNGKH